MNILHLQNEINIACGVSKTIYFIVQNTDKDFNHFVICLGGDGLKRFEDAGIYPTILNYNRFSISGTIKVFFFLLNYCKKNKIDIIHSHHRYFDLLSSFISKFIKVNTLMSAQSIVYGKKYISYKSKKIIACSNYVKNHLINYFDVNPGKVDVIHNFIDTSEFPKNLSRNIRQYLNIGEKQFVIGYIGRIYNKEKGIDILLNALELLNKDFNEFLFLVIGNGPDKEEVKKSIKEKKFNSIILDAIFNISDYINICDLIVLPSRVEPFGIICLEAGYLKKAFIGSDNSGITEIITNKQNGLLFENGNFISLATNMKLLINDHSFRKKLGENLYKTVTSNFTTINVIEKYKAIYNSF